MSDYITIADALDGLRENKITASQLLENALATADAVDEQLGIYLHRFDDQARAAAAAADKTYQAGDPAGALEGIPLGIKDIIATIDGPTTAQSLVLDPAWGESQGDAVVAARLRAAGGVFAGKVTTLEFATGGPDPEKPFPIPRNPWNPEYWAGGSSSGTGNGVAAGAFLGGLGTDTGGSIRMPSAFCGITGLKGTFGRVPKSGVTPLGYSLDNVGPMARSSRDCAIMLGVMAGYDASDPCAADEPVVDYVSALTGDLTGLRIGFDPLTTFRPDMADSELDSVLSAAISVLTEAGAVVEQIDLPLYREILAANMITMRSEAFAYHAPDLRSRWSDYSAGLRLGVGSAPAYTGAEYVQAQRVRRYGQGEVAKLFERYDILVTPTASVGSIKLDEMFATKVVSNRMAAIHTMYWNAMGNPAMSIPIGFGQDAMPLGLQIIGRPFDEATVLKTGEAYQRQTDWHLRVPPMVSEAALQQS